MKPGTLVRLFDGCEAYYATHALTKESFLITPSMFGVYIETIVLTRYQPPLRMNIVLISSNLVEVAQGVMEPLSSPSTDSEKFEEKVSEIG